METSEKEIPSDIVENNSVKNIEKSENPLDPVDLVTGILDKIISNVVKEHEKNESTTENSKSASEDNVQHCLEILMNLLKQSVVEPEKPKTPDTIEHSSEEITNKDNTTESSIVKPSFRYESDLARFRAKYPEVFCPFCDLKIDCSDSLLKHLCKELKLEESEENVSIITRRLNLSECCSECSFEESSFEVVLDHMISDHFHRDLKKSIEEAQNILGLESNRCPFFGCKAESDDNLIRHYGNDHGVILFMRARNSSNGTKIYRILKTGNTGFLCLLCEQILWDENSFLIHLSDHFRDRLWESILNDRCPLCNFSDSKTLYLHLGAVHRLVLRFLDDDDDDFRHTVDLQSLKSFCDYFRIPPKSISQTFLLKFLKKFKKSLSELNQFFDEIAYLSHEDTLKNRSKSEYFCLDCGFELNDGLNEHLKDHGSGTVACLACQIPLIYYSDPITAISLHNLERAHIFNTRSGIDNRRRIVPASGFCPVCEETDIEAAHSHSDYFKVRDRYLQYCDLRMVNPVTAPVNDLISFLDFSVSYFKSKGLNLIQVLIYLSKIHDDPTICANSSITRKVFELKSLDYKLGCFVCPFFSENYEEFVRHLASENHGREFELWKAKSNTKFSTNPNRDFVLCFSCDDKRFNDKDLVSLHRFSSNHLRGIRNYNDFFCSLCGFQCHKTNLSGHIASSYHSEATNLANSYFEFRKSKIEFLKTLELDFVEEAVVILDRIDSISTSPEIRNFVAEAEMRSSGYYPTLNGSEIDYVTRCYYCDKVKFRHLTYLMYHLYHVHDNPPSVALKKLVLKNREVINCDECPKKSFSSHLIYAIHRDAHHSAKKCRICFRKYPSILDYYKKDRCKGDYIPDIVKNLVNQTLEAILLTNDITNKSKSEEGKPKRGGSQEDNNDDEPPLLKKVKDSSLSNLNKAEVKIEGKSEVNEGMDVPLTKIDTIEEDFKGDVKKRPLSCSKSSVLSTDAQSKKSRLEDEEKSSSSSASVGEVQSFNNNESTTSEEGAKKRDGKEESRSIIGCLSTNGSKSQTQTLKRNKPKIGPKSIKVAQDLQAKEDEKGPADRKSEVGYPSPSGIKVFSKRSKCQSTEIPKSISETGAKSKDKSGTLSSKKFGTPKAKIKDSGSKSSSISPKKLLCHRNSPSLKSPKKLSKFQTQSCIRAAQPKMGQHSALLSKSNLEINKIGQKRLSKVSSSENLKIRSKLTRSKTFTEEKGSKSLRNEMYKYFCLDCENCPGESCNHLNHPRTVVTRSHRLRNPGHSRVQPIDEFVKAECPSILDLAYSKRYGNKVRNQFKKVISKTPPSPKSWSRMPSRKCKACPFISRDIFEAFRHIREVHLNN